ncbi:MAG TPA: YeeE/YedE thiosulfate transporter family protein [Polyangiaceae bacterium]
MSDFTPFSALAGGALLGLSASLLLWHQGRVAGISGILDSFLAEPKQSLGWRLPFLAGLVVAGFVASLFVPRAFGAPIQGVVPLALAGVLVGFGSRLGNGCTAGHAISGLSRLSVRSAVATTTFIAAGMITTYVTFHLGGGS